MQQPLGSGLWRFLEDVAVWAGQGRAGARHRDACCLFGIVGTGSGMCRAGQAARLWGYYRGRQPAAACRGGGWHRQPCAPCSLLRSGAQAGRVMDGTRPVLGVPVRAWRHQRLGQLRPMRQCAGAGSGRGDTCGHAWRLGTRRSISGTLAGPCASTGAGVQAAAGRQGMCFSAHPESAARREREKMRFGRTFPYRRAFTGLWQQRQAIMGRQSPCRSREN